MHLQVVLPKDLPKLHIHSHVPISFDRLNMGFLNRSESEYFFFCVINFFFTRPAPFTDRCKNFQFWIQCFNRNFKTDLVIPFSSTTMCNCNGIFFCATSTNFFEISGRDSADTSGYLFSYKCELEVRSTHTPVQILLSHQLHMFNGTNL